MVTFRLEKKFGEDTNKISLLVKCNNSLSATSAEHNHKGLLYSAVLTPNLDFLGYLFIDMF